MSAGTEATIVLIDRAQNRVIWRLTGGRYRVVQYPDVDDFRYDAAALVYDERRGHLLEEFDLTSMSAAERNLAADGSETEVSH